MSKATAWLIVIGGLIISILVDGYLYDIPFFIANAAVGIGILGTIGDVNKKYMSKATAWLIVIGGLIISILVDGYLYDIPSFIANAAVGVGILGTYSDLLQLKQKINKTK